MLRAVEPGEIEQILALTDRMEIHRESVAIPLARRDPGGARRLGSGKVEITVPDTADFAEWLGGLEERLRALI